MEAAKVKFRIVMEYQENIIERNYPECPEDNMNIHEAIDYTKENLETYREDLYGALEEAVLVNVTVEETEHYTIPDLPANDYQI